MTIHRAKTGRLFGAAMLVLLFTVFSAYAYGGEGCVAFQATTQGSFHVAPPPMGWYADAYFTIGDAVMQATIIWKAKEVVVERMNQHTFMGTERGVVTVEGLGTFELVSHFTSPHRTFKDGVAILNESGTIGGGTGVFAGISGHFTHHGVYGPAVTGADPPAGRPLGFASSMNGNICGLDLNDPRFTPASN
jgi:hypothetical protein